MHLPLGTFLSFAGEIKLYKAEDSGEKKHLASIQAPKLLPLKVSCPVMLTVNLSEHLVNGLTGIVTDLQDNSVQVHFPSINKQCNLSAFPFTVYDKQKHVDIACRRQIPLKLSFALTVHKAQGLSLNRVSVNCSKMNQDGQIYVALSRATCKKGLQVRNFNKALLKKPTDNILDFYSLPQKVPHDNLLCCTRNETKEISQSSESVLEAIFDPSYEPQDIFLDEDEEMDKCVSFIETYDEDNIAYHLPESVNPDQILKTVQPKFIETAEQKSEMSVMKSSSYTVKLLQYFWNAFMILKEKIFVEGKVTNKATTDFYREIHQFLIQDKMMNMVNIFDGDVAARQNVVFRLSSEVRKMALEHSVSLIKQKAKEKGEKEKGIAYAESPGGRGKIRYIGGWCVRSIKRVKKSKLMKNLYKEKKRELNLNLRKQLDLLDKLESTEYQLLETSEDTESLDEIMRKQNVRKGLTNISDKCFNFFLLLDKKIRLLETTANIDIHGTNFHSFVISQLQKDESLLNAFNSQFSTQISQEEAKTLQNEFISKYSMMSLCQLRKSYLKDMKSQKTEAHRKQIKMREKSGRTGGKLSLFNFTSIKEDTSVGKMISHRRLQSEILKSEDFLSSTFTKAELEKLCLACKCPFDKKLSKKSTSEKLHEIISSSESMLNTSTFGNLGSPDESRLHVNLAPLEAQCIEPVASTSGLVSAVQSKVSNVSPPVIAKRRRPTKRGKKGQKKRKTGPKYPCGVCKRECEDNVLGCDGCDSWFHADCLKIEDLDELPDKWFCNECGNI